MALGETGRERRSLAPEVGRRSIRAEDMAMPLVTRTWHTPGGLLIAHPSTHKLSSEGLSSDTRAKEGFGQMGPLGDISHHSEKTTEGGEGLA